LPVDERDDPRRDEERDGPDHPRERFLFRGASSVKQYDNARFVVA